MSQILLNSTTVGDESKDGTVIGRVSVDLPNPENFNFRLVDDADGRFVLIGRDLRIFDTSRIDAETAGSHTIRLIARDERGTEIIQEITLTVENQNEAPTPAVLDDKFVRFDALSGEKIGNLSAADKEGDAITFSLVDDAGGRFATDGNSLVVLDGSKLDYNTSTTHSITVRATDALGNFTDQVMTIELEDPLAILRRDGTTLDLSRYKNIVTETVAIRVTLIDAVKTESGKTLVFWAETHGTVGGAQPGKINLDIYDEHNAFVSSSIIASGIYGGIDFDSSSLGKHHGNISHQDVPDENFDLVSVNGEYLLVAQTIPYSGPTPPYPEMQPAQTHVYRFNASGALLGEANVSALASAISNTTTEGILIGINGPVVRTFPIYGAGTSLVKLIDTMTNSDGNLTLLIQRFDIHTMKSESYSEFGLGATNTSIADATSSISTIRLDQNFQAAGTEQDIASWHYSEGYPFHTLDGGTSFISQYFGMTQLAGGGAAMLFANGIQAERLSYPSPQSGIFDMTVTILTGAGNISKTISLDDAFDFASFNIADISALPDGGFAVTAWNNDAALGLTAAVQIFDSNGNELTNVTDIPAPPGMAYADAATIDGLGFVLIWAPENNADIGARLATVLDQDGNAVITIPLPAGYELDNSRANALTGIHLDRNNDPKSALPYASNGGAQVVINSTTGEQPQDFDGDGDLDLAGEFTLGLAGHISSTLRIVGDAELFADKIIIKNSLVFAAIGNVTEPLFRGTFTIDRRTGVASDFSATAPADGFTLAGLAVDWKGLRLTTVGAGFDITAHLPTSISSGQITPFAGPTALQLTQEGLRLGGGEVRLGTFTIPDYLSIFGAVEAKDIVIRYDHTQHQLAIDGEVKVGEKKFGDASDFSLTFKNLKITDGKIDFQGIMAAKEIGFPVTKDRLKLKDVAISLTIQQDVVQALSAGASVDLLGAKLPDGTVALEVVRAADGTLDLNKIVIGATDINKPIGEGFFLQKVLGTIKDLANEVTPVPTSLSGTLGFSWGAKVELDLPPFLGGSHVEGFAVSFELGLNGRFDGILSGTGTAQIISPSIFSFSGEQTYDFTKGTLKMAGTSNWFEGVLVGQMSQTISTAGAASFAAGVSIAVPNIPTLGPVAGLSIASGNVAFSFTPDGNFANDYVAGWAIVPLPAIGATVLGLQFNFLTSTFTPLLNANNLPKTNSFDVNGDEDWLMIAAVWENPQSGHILTRVRPPGVTPGDPDNSHYIQEADYAAHGITILQDLSSPTKLTIVIDNPGAGNWDLQIVDPTGFGHVTYTGFSPDTAPDLSFDSTTRNGDGSMQLSGHAIDSGGNTTVTLFYDTDASGLDGVMLGQTTVDANGYFTAAWNIANVTRDEYYIYAVAFDGETAPVFGYNPTPVLVAHAPTNILLTGAQASAGGQSATISAASPAHANVANLSMIDQDAGETAVFSLIDDADGRFIINGNALLVSRGAVLDAARDGFYTVTVRATDQDGLTVDRDLQIDLTPSPDALPVVWGTVNTDNLFTPGAGPAILVGLDGNDRINGSLSDGDVAAFSGNFSDYLLQWRPVDNGGGFETFAAVANPDMKLHIIDIRPGNPDGDDVLSDIEFLRFADGQISVTEALEPALNLPFPLREIGGGRTLGRDLNVGGVQIVRDDAGLTQVTLAGEDAALFSHERIGNSLVLRLLEGTVLDADTNPTLDVAVILDDPSLGTSSEDQIDLSFHVVEPDADDFRNILFFNSPMERNVFTYSFEVSNRTFDILGPRLQNVPLSEAARSLARAAFEDWMDIANIVFVEAPAGLGDIQVGSVFQQGTDVLAAGDPPFSGIGMPQQLVFNASAPEFQLDYWTWLHEIGHVLGLRHSFDSFLGNDVLSTIFDSSDYTVMSYTDGTFDSYAPRILDIQAAQFLYGAEDNAQWSWDAGNLVLTQIAEPGGQRLSGQKFADHMIGSSNSDTFNAFGGDDEIAGGGGNDTINGGDGLRDVAIFSGRHSDYDFSFGVDENDRSVTFTVVDTRLLSDDGMDTLTGIEFLRFADGDFSIRSLAGGPNDPPVVTSADIAFTAENSTDIFYQAQATDTDPVVTFSLEGSDAHFFSIDASTGEMRFISPADYEAPQDANGDNIYHVTLVASDGDAQGRKSISIEIQDTGVSTSVGEGSVNPFYAVTAPETFGPHLSYEILGPDAAFFSIDSAIGALRFTNAPDFEIPADADGDGIYSIVSSVSDGLNLFREDLAIHVGDLFDVRFEENSGSLLYQLPPGSVLTNFAGADSEQFVFDDATGGIHFVSSPDFEAPADSNADNLYEVMVLYAVTINLFGAPVEFEFSQQLLIEVADADDAPTVISTNNVLAAISENSVLRTKIADVIVADPDMQAVFRNNAIKVDDDRFEVIDNELFLKSGQTVNFEATPAIILTLSVGTSSTILTLDVTNVNEAPSAVDPLHLTTIEDTAVAGSAATTDADDTMLVYSLETAPATGVINLNTETGAFTFTPATNDDQGRSFVIRATDAGGLFTDIAVNVDVSPVNDAPTVAISLVDLSSLEDTDITFTLPEYSFTDVDLNALSLSATLANGSALPDWLAFNAATRSFSGTPPSGFNGDFEIKVTASDGSLSASDVFSLAIAPVNDAPTALDFTGGPVAENSASGTVIGTLAGVDPDFGDSFTYSLVAGAGSADNGLVSIVGNQIVVNGAIDFETNPTLDLRARVTDAGGLFFERTLAINVSDVVEGPPVNVVTGTSENDRSVSGIPAGFFGGLLGAIFPDAFRGLRGTPGLDSIDAGDGNDVVYGFGGNDTVLGGQGNDSLYGDTADGFLGLVQGFAFATGADGNDSILGGAGDDSIWGGGGNDAVNGGSGRDVLTGGSGADWFVFDDGDSGLAARSRDRIQDFSRAEGDRIDLTLIDGNPSTPADDDLTLVTNQTTALRTQGSVFLERSAGGVQTVFINTDNSLAGFEMAIDVVTGRALQASDFLL